MVIESPNEFVVIDVETTGLDPARGHEIIEIGAQKLKGQEVVDEFTALVKPVQPLTGEVAEFHATTGMTQALLEAEGRPVAEVMPQLITFIGPAVIIAHNAPFDIGFVNAHLDKLGLPRLQNRTIDTIEIAKRYLILSSYRLNNVAAYLKVPQPSAHRALIDVITTREVFFKLIARAQGKK